MRQGTERFLEHDRPVSEESSHSFFDHLALICVQEKCARRLSWQNGVVCTWP